MVSGRSVTGLKSAISFLVSHGINDLTPRKGKSKKKKGKTEIWYMACVLCYYFLEFFPFLGV